MRRIFVLLLLFCVLISTGTVHAQGTPALSTVELWIWPEYDQPEVLIIQRMLVSSNTSLPVNMTFRIPAVAQQPSAMAVGETFDAVGDVPYTLETEGKWVEVTVAVTARAIQLEYYDPSLTKDGKERQYGYEWAGDYAVDNIHVELQQPFDASNLAAEPSLTVTNPISGGLTYYTGDFGALDAGQPFTLDVSYTKETDALSISFMNIQPSAPVNENTSGRVSLDTYLPWLVGAFGVLMIAGGLYYYFRGSARPRGGVRRRHTAGEESSSGQVYCPQCGARARSGDRFCRTCGTRLRNNE